MSDINFYSAKPGDVCNLAGDIRSIDQNGEATIVSRGVVLVSPQQANSAANYGWTHAGTEGDLVRIERRF